VAQEPPLNQPGAAYVLPNEIKAAPGGAATPIEGLTQGE
jgi:hypothetical protein